MQKKRKIKRSVKTEVALVIAFSVLLTVALISLLANVFLDKEFVSYVTQEHQLAKENLAQAISAEYLGESMVGAQQEGHGRMHGNQNASSAWNITKIQAMSTAALEEGLLLHIKDSQGNTVWNVEQQNGPMCHKVIAEIEERMSPRLGNNGSLTLESFLLLQDEKTIGTVDISSYGPYYLSDSEFRLLNSLNKIVWFVGLFSLAIAIGVGLLLARRFSRPILKTAQVASQMATGNYQIRIRESHGTRELDDLIGSINYLADTLEKQEKLRKVLTADVAHELRTPLTTVSTHIEAMIENIWEPTPERLQSISDELERIRGLVHQLENLASLENENTNLVKQAQNLWDSINTAINNFDFELAEKNITVERQGSETTAAVDTERFYQVIYNLLSNAIKFTPEGGHITITTKVKGDFVDITVQDTGIGIPSEELPYVFERFYRADKSRARKTGGTGIGLAIVKSIVVAHGGMVTVTSPQDEGACFTVTLPIE